MNSRIKLFLFLSLFSFVHTYGQLQPRYPVSMPSANASNLALFDETPVSKFTGIPGINVPLYTINEGNLSVSLGLSYHAAGVQPDVHPGWVGSGWSIQSGGSITRKVNGIPDEYPTDIGGYYDNPNILSATDWTTTTNLQYYGDHGYDVAPDEFTFNAGGVSGKFVLDNLGNWQVQCDQDVKVVFNSSTDFTTPFMTTAPPNPYGWTTYYRCFGKFTLITPDGTSYVFGGNSNAIDYSLDFFNQNSSNLTATAWYLTQIISADGLHVINLTYERDQYTNVLYRTLYKNNENISVSGTVACHGDVPITRSTALIGGNLISPVYLKTIETSKELITFNRSTSVELRYPQSLYTSSYQSYSKRLNLAGNEQEQFQSIAERQVYGDTVSYKFLPLLRINGLTSYPADLNNLQWKKLDNISFTDKSTSQVFKQFAFSYSNSTNQRLTLNSLKESNPSGALTDTVPPYRFYYDVSKVLPTYLAEATDDWGYAKASTTSIINDTNFYYRRPPNPDFTGVGTLRKMIYPTGGYKLFFFEPNNYSTVVSPDHSAIYTTNNTLGGGLRIKAIYDYDPFTKTLKSKKYFYYKNFVSPNQANAVSSGIISGLPQYSWQGGNTLPTGENLSSDLKSRNTLLPLSENADGSQVGYSEVAEVADDKGFTVSKFTNFDDGHLDEPFISSMFPGKEIFNNFTSVSAERGKLKYSATYNSAGKRLRSSAITYAPLHNNKTYVRATDVRKYQVCDFGNPANGLSGPYLYEGGAFKIYTYSYLPVSVVDSVLDSTIPVVTVSNMYYDNPLNKLLTRTEKLRTDGQKLTTLTSYPQDYATGTTFIDNMVSKNLLALPIEKVNYLTDPSAGNVKILSGAVTVYNPVNSFLKDTDSMVETIAPVSLANFKFSGSVKGVLPYNTGKLVFSKDPLYKAKANYLYNAAFNLAQVNQTDGTSSAVLWGYSNSLPVAQVMNAKISEVYFNGFEEDLSGTSTDSKTGNKSRLLAGGTFTLPTMPALSSGQKYLLTYWYKNTGGNWTFSSGSYSTLPASIAGYNLIDEVRICSQNAQMATAAYLTSRGQLASKTDEGTRTLHYTYDGLQRLKLITDENQNILQDYTYNYAPAQTALDAFYYNTPKSGTYQRIGCTVGTGTYVTYEVTAGTYTSTISQAKADSLAQNDVNLNGQTFANFTGKCVFYNAAQSTTYNRTDCAPQAPTPYVISIPQGTYSSEISQADADAQATNETNSRLGYAPSLATCHVPVATISVADSYAAGTVNKQFSITLTNTSTHTAYASGTVNPAGNTSFTVPPGTYSITYTVGSPLNSLQLIYNNSLVACKGNQGTTGNFANITLADHDTVAFYGGAIDCPALP